MSIATVKSAVYAALAGVMPAVEYGYPTEAQNLLEVAYVGDIAAPTTYGDVKSLGDAWGVSLAVKVVRDGATQQVISDRALSLFATCSQALSGSLMPALFLKLTEGDGFTSRSAKAEGVVVVPTLLYGNSGSGASAGTVTVSRWPATLDANLTPVGAAVQVAQVPGLLLEVRGATEDASGRGASARAQVSLPLGTDVRPGDLLDVPNSGRFTAVQVVQEPYVLRVDVEEHRL